MSDKEIIINYIVNASGGIQKSLKELAAIILILGIVIIINQCRIRKQLHQIQKQLEQKEDNE